MERPKATIEPAKDEYDHELTPVQADFIALTDALLEHRDDSSELTFVDLAVDCSASEVLEKLNQTRFSSLIAGPDDQLAIKSDGSYYPILDLRKSQGQLTGVGVRAWGWDDKKIRFTGRDNEPPMRGKEYIKYSGEIDKTREIDISFGYTIGEEYVVETIKLFGSTLHSDYVTAYSSLGCMAYSETGYEGHGGKRFDDLRDEDVEQFLNLVADVVGDTPKSRGEKIDEELAEFHERWVSAGYGSEVDELIQLTWPAQAHYELSGRQYIPLNDATIMESIERDEIPRERVQKVVDLMLKVFRMRKAERDLRSNT